jgi:hypothetical protein
MDKHTKRYFSEQFRHWHEGMNMDEAMDYINAGADQGYLSSAIQSHFEGAELQFLQNKLYEKRFEASKQRVKNSNWWED